MGKNWIGKNRGGKELVGNIPRGRNTGVGITGVEKT